VAGLGRGGSSPLGRIEKPRYSGVSLFRLVPVATHFGVRDNSRDNKRIRLPRLLMPLGDPSKERSASSNGTAEGSNLLPCLLRSAPWLAREWLGRAHVFHYHEGEMKSIESVEADCRRGTRHSEMPFRRAATIRHEFRSSVRLSTLTLASSPPSSEDANLKGDLVRASRGGEKFVSVASRDI
jgi:hypothetical protein